MSITKTRNSILTVADILFSRFGFHKTSMDEIAKTARKAKGSLYYHFATKEDLFKEVLAIELNKMKSRLMSIIDNPNINASEKIRSYFKKKMKNLNTSANYKEILKADFFEHFHFVDDLRNELDEWEENNLKKIILQGVNSGEFVLSADIHTLVGVITMTMKGLEIPFFLQDKYKKFSQHFDGLITILIKGLLK